MDTIILNGSKTAVAITPFEVCNDYIVSSWTEQHRDFTGGTFVGSFAEAIALAKTIINEDAA